MAFPKAQNPLDWLTQCWHIGFGRRVDPEKDEWLIGQQGKPGETAETFIERLAVDHNLTVHRNDPGSGLLSSLDGWSVAINHKVADFYRHTCDYSFDTTSRWQPRFGALAKMVSKLFSRRVQQFNLPHDAAAFRNDIIQLKGSSGIVAYTLWLRSIKSSGEVVSYGLYSKCALPSGGPGVKAVFPLPQGNVTVVFAVQTEPNGGLRLVSSGSEYRETGFYAFVEDSRGNLWKHYLPAVRQFISVYSSDNVDLKAVHIMNYWKLRAYEMNYSIRKNG